MATMTAHSGLQLVHDTRKKTLSLVETLSQQEIEASPEAGKWSVGEILDHLIKADEVYYKVIRELFHLKQSGREPYIRKNFKDINASVLGLPKSALSYFEVPFGMFNLFVPRTIRTFLMTSRWFPTEAPDIAKPVPGRSGETLRHELNAAPSELDDLFMNQPDLKFEHYKFYHPLFGENNLYQLLQILTYHESIHQKQIQETIQRIR